MSDELKMGEQEEKEESRLAYELRQQKKANRDLQERLEAAEAKKHDEDLGIGDDSNPVSRKLAMEIRDIKKQMSEIQSQAFRTDEDAELEPYLRQVLDDNPELLKAYPTPGRRLEAARVMARGLQAQDTNTRSSQSRKDAIPRVHLSGGGPSASRNSRSKENDWATFQEKMRDPKLTSEQKKELADKWDAEHPED